VRGNGWDDIGYNFLVDKYGQAFEGRYGGMERAVVGAHAMGFNFGSVGVALLGNYNGVGLTAAERASLVKLLAWRLASPISTRSPTVTRVSAGNPEYKQGDVRLLRAVSGHRDTYKHKLPGQQRLCPASFDHPPDRFDGAAENLLTDRDRRGRRHCALHGQALLGGSWTVTVVDSLNRTVATGTGTSTSIDWTWDATLTAPVPTGTRSRPAPGYRGGSTGDGHDRNYVADRGRVTATGWIPPSSAERGRVGDTARSSTS